MMMNSDSASLIKYYHRTGRIFNMKTYGDAMLKKMVIGMCRNRFWYFVFSISFSWFLFLYLFKSSMMVTKNNKVTLLGDNHANFVDEQEFHFVEHLHESSNDGMHILSDDHEEEPTNSDKKDVSSPIENSVIWTSDWVKIADEVLASENGGFDNETPPVNKINGKKIKKKSYKTVATKMRKRVKQVKSVKSPHIVKITAKQVAKAPERKNELEVGLDFESCKGKFIYVHHLPRRFNEDLLRHCESLSDWYNMCEFTSNNGLGPHLKNSEKVYTNNGWFATNQFLLEVIFHNRMKQYKCLTSNSSLASAIFVPYYPGLDLNRYLWSNSTMKMKDLDALELVKWLRRKPEWKRMRGRDHFLVAGRISWDFLRESDKESGWGNKLLLLPEIRNMTMLVIESSPWNNNDFAIPYPTYFHPSNDSEVFQWQNRMRRQQRPFLFSFAGGPRHSLQHYIRNEVIDQCRASRKCRLLECAGRSNRCNKPIYVMKMFQNSVFCLQPSGDSYTRRSTFDCILAGCIPVFFHPGSAYVQYTWHLPKDYTKYSVFIPDIDVKHGKVSIERILDKIPKEKVLAMREEVIRLIPRVIYADPNSRLETLEDAFDITVKEVLNRVESIRREMSEGENMSTDIAERVAWKYNLFGTVGKHEWDRFFVRPE